MTKKEFLDNRDAGKYRIVRTGLYALNAFELNERVKNESYDTLLKHSVPTAKLLKNEVYSSSVRLYNYEIYVILEESIDIDGVGLTYNNILYLKV